MFVRACHISPATSTPPSLSCRFWCCCLPPFRGSLVCSNFIVPFFGHSVRISQLPPDEDDYAAEVEWRHVGRAEGWWARGLWSRQRISVERAYGTGESTYFYQLVRSRAFSVLPSLLLLVMQKRDPQRCLATFPHENPISSMSTAAAAALACRPCTCLQERFVRDVAAVRDRPSGPSGGKSAPLPLEAMRLDELDAADNMRLLDQAYIAAGLQPRTPSP